ncbi:mandelate racemase [Streptomyces sulfonofaciens]|uniref:Mandelate racemase n=1 Tax=Streptomyces sulfonofaciens TaxID=68272 RepID=A0A919GLH3_9ACTN|nr:enolase C-terminal domain-like protein [Streptomyces sulfonofaciens]GHH86459.1 mandelate racemase [Streptomyces sulfonofaciens]
MTPAPPGADRAEGPALTVRSVGASSVLVPMKRPLGTSAARITKAPLLLIDLLTEEGVTGRAYLFCYLPSAQRAAAALVGDVGAFLAGAALSPGDVHRSLASRFRLLGTSGLVGAVMAGVDVACWDALAIAAGLPLARLLGATPRPIPAYNSNGLGLVAAEAAAAEAQELVAEGFRAVKMRLGRASAHDDLAAVRAVRGALPADIAVMADYNQALRLDTARERCGHLDDEGLYWIEEPVRHDDYAGTALLAAALRTPVQIGENFEGPRAMSLALHHRASDVVMPDLQRIGGVSGWRDAAALADVAGIPMSSHLFPEVSSALLAATPTAHWLEYVDWANPVLTEPLRIVDGCAAAQDRPGNGLVWDEDAVARYRVD